MTKLFLSLRSSLLRAMFCVISILSRHRVKYGLDHFLDHFLDYFLDYFLDHFLDYFLDHFLDHFIGGSTPLVLREGWDAVY